MFNFGRGFCSCFSAFFQRLQLLAIKTFWNNSYCIVLLFVWAQKVCRWFSKSYFRLEIFIFLSFVVTFLVDMFNYEAPFLTKTTSSVNLRHSLEQKLSKFNMLLKESSITGRSWSSAKLFIMQNYTDNANDNVPLTICLPGDTGVWKLLKVFYL